MKAKTLTTLFTGILVGTVATAALLYGSAQTLMFKENLSKYDREQTVSVILETTQAAGWKVPATHNLHKTIAKAGLTANQTTVIELCNTQHAAKILSDDNSMFVSSMMPCRVAVYEKSSGETVISRMNSDLMAKLFNKNIEETMSAATADTEMILKAVIAE